MDRVQQPDPQRKVLSGKDRCKVRDLLLKKKESASSIQAYFSPPLLCLSSCASSFISTSIFINLLLASQGDRIQALTRISPQIDWYCSAQGTLGKKALAFPPSFPLSFLSLLFFLCLQLRPVFPRWLLVSHLSVPCHLLLQSWQAAAAGFWRSNLLRIYKTFSIKDGSWLVWKWLH